MTAPPIGPSHRAIVRLGSSIVLARRPTPRPGPGEISVAPEVAGLCGTDLQMIRGLRDDPAPVIGHEGLARIVTVGDGVPDRLRPGQRVVINPTHPRDPSFLLGHNLDGLLQERTLLPATAVRDGMVLAVPDQLDRALAPLVEPLAVVRYALTELRRFGPRTLVVIGDGVIGHLCVRAARSWLSADVPVVLVHHTAAGRRYSESVGYAGVRLADASALPSPGPRQGPVGVILATPRNATLDALGSALALPGSDLVVDIIGGLPPEARTTLLPELDLGALRAENCAGLPSPARTWSADLPDGRRVRFFGHRGVGNAHLLDSMAELAGRPDRYRDLITHVADLSNAVRIMKTLARSSDRIIDGHRLIKLAVTIGAMPVRPAESAATEGEGK